MPLDIRDRSRPSTPGYFRAETEGAGLIEWAPIAERFAASRNYWVGTASKSGRPHAMPVWGVWLGDRFAFSTSPASRKARNLRSNPGVAVHLEDGNAVIVIEGRARELRNAEELSAFLVAYNPKYQWNFTPDQVTDGVFEVTPEIAFAWLGGEGEAFGGTATRWRFDVPTAAKKRKKAKAKKAEREKTKSKKGKTKKSAKRKGK
jgi:nitroimidazol reductase NimA-like FMN-containing flavoprotein (pyridoxamine 5'-phosphate oxidase superfamily)